MRIKELTVIIVTFKSEDKVFSCLDSLSNDVDIIVVENSNNINFKKIIEEKYSHAKCILTGENKGYAVANNIGLSNVNTKYALVLNPDTVLKKDAIQNFLDRAKSTPNFWLIGPANEQAEKMKNNAKDFYQVKNLKGHAIFFNLKKFNKKYFDENFFLYFEEIDLCNQVNLNGGSIFLDRKIIIDHDGASSVKQTNNKELEKNRNWHWMWSTFYYHKKYKGLFLALLIISPKLISSSLKIIFYQLSFNILQRDIYLSRMGGIVNSILGRKSWHRPSLD